MLSLLLKGKVPISEDVFSAAFFGAFRLLQKPGPLRAILALASRRGATLTVPDFDTYEIELWPAHRSGEPDARVLMYRRGHIVGRVIVEAKLGAEKSGTGVVSEDGTRGDQLARYLRGEAEDHPATAVWLIYLTHHAACPRVEVEASELHLSGRDGRDDLRDRLFWLSWRDVEAALHDLGDTLPWTELRAVFKLVSMHRFRGMRLEAVGRLDGHWAYPTRKKESRTYPGTSALKPPSETEWRYVRRAVRRPYAWPSTPRLHAEAEFYGGGSDG